MDKEVEKIPGVEWGFSQPIADNMEEAVSGVKGELAVKIFGSDLNDLEQNGEEIMDVMKTVPGVADLGLFRVLGQPNVNIKVDRAKADRYGINASDVQDAMQTAIGGNPVSQILIGEQRFDLVPRYQEQFRSIDRRHQEHSPAGALRRAGLAGRVVRHHHRRWRVDDLSRRQPALHRASSTACAAATWAAPSKKP